MLDEHFRKQRASMVRDLAARADPYIKRRLLDLAERYEGPAPPHSRDAGRFAVGSQDRVRIGSLIRGGCVTRLAARV